MCNIIKISQKIGALGGNAALWPGDDSNFDGEDKVNNHAYLQLTGVGANISIWSIESLLFQKDATTWGFNYW